MSHGPDLPQPYMVRMQPQCPSCGGTYEHDEDCDLRTPPIPLAANLGLEEARREVKRRAENEQ